MKTNGCAMLGGANSSNPGCGNHGTREECQPYAKPGAIMRRQSFAGALRKYSTWRTEHSPERDALDAVARGTKTPVHGAGYIRRRVAP